MESSTRGPVRWPPLAGAALLLAVVALGICEAQGWPFLALPMQRWMSEALARPVSFSEAVATEPVATTATMPVTLHLLGRIEIIAPYLRIGAPAWSREPHMLVARDARLRLG